MPDINQVECKLIELNTQIGEAEMRHNDEDVAFLVQVLSDDLIFRRANGQIVRKKEFLWDLIQPENTFDYLIPENVEPKVFEDTAVVSLLVRAKGKRGEAGFEGVYRNLRLFQKREGEWRCVVWFNTEIKA